MSRSRSTSLRSDASLRDASSEENDSSFHTSDGSSSFNVSDLAYDMQTILEQFVPEEYLPEHEEIEDKLKDLYPGSERRSEQSHESMSHGEERKSVSETGSNLSQMSLSEARRSRSDSEKDHESIEISSGENAIRHDIDEYVEKLRSVARGLDLHRFIGLASDELLREQFEMLFEQSEVNITSLRPERIDKDGRALKGILEKEQSNPAHVKRPKLLRKTKREIQSEQEHEVADARSVKDYARNCMGGFEPEHKEGKVLVSLSSSIERPTNVTGNLGRAAGDHVVPLTQLTRYL